MLVLWLWLGSGGKRGHDVDARSPTKARTFYLLQGGKANIGSSPQTAGCGCRQGRSIDRSKSNHDRSKCLPVLALHRSNPAGPLRLAENAPPQPVVEQSAQKLLASSWCMGCDARATTHIHTHALKASPQPVLGGCVAAVQRQLIAAASQTCARPPGRLRFWR